MQRQVLDGDVVDGAHALPLAGALDEEHLAAPHAGHDLGAVEVVDDHRRGDGVARPVCSATHTGQGARCTTVRGIMTSSAEMWESQVTTLRAQKLGTRRPPAWHGGAPGGDTLAHALAPDASAPLCLSKKEKRMGQDLAKCHRDNGGTAQRGGTACVPRASPRTGMPGRRGAARHEKAPTDG